MPHTPTIADNALSAVEKIKQSSKQLRGELLKSLADPLTGALREADQTIIKYHGSYQQDDRDRRNERRDAKLEADYSFMIRTRTPGGVISPKQWLDLDTVARTYASRGLRITSRQAIQFHGVVKTELKATMQAINATLIDTLAACGDVNRNIAVAVNPAQSQVHAAVYQASAALSERLLPNTRAYYEIWLDEEPNKARRPGEATNDSSKRVLYASAGSGDDQGDIDPIYGERYLPRKFKIGVVVPPINDVDIYTQDLGFIAIVGAGTGGEHDVLGYNVTAGGGMGASHNDAETFPRLADTLGYIDKHDMHAVALAVVSTQRDFGNRDVRKRARLKYTIEDRGLPWFIEQVQQRSGVQLAPARPVTFTTSGDQLGWLSAADGSLHLGLRIVSGRIEDRSSAPHLSALRSVAKLLAKANESTDPISNNPEHTPPAQFRLTPNQNLLIANVPPALRAQVQSIINAAGLGSDGGITEVLTHAMACVSLPSCGLAMAEAERYLPEFSEKLQALLQAVGLAGEPLQLRISGCPNGCSRPYASEVALVGKAPGRYNLMLGGDHLGTRLNQLYRENLAESELLLELAPLLQKYATERLPAERFGDYCVRAAMVSPPKPRSAIQSIPVQVLP
jgi:sulfite reductase (NADPH) hemoprotein beta-component